MARRLAGAVGPYHAYRAAASVVAALPAPVVTGLARAASRLMLRRMHDRRTTVRRHQRRVHGAHLSERQLDRNVRAAFDSYARYWAEVFRLPRYSPADLESRMSYEGLQHLDGALATGNGAVIALPHLGGWDFGGAWFASRGYDVTVVVEPLEPPELFEWFASFRRRLGMTVVALGPDAGTTVLQALRRGGIVGLVCDRDLLGTGVEVDFFGERTTLPSGPATLALRAQAALIPVALYHGRGRTHHGVMRPPIPLDRSGRFREDVERITQLLATELETLIRRAPEQWHMFQPNWPSDRTGKPVPLR